MRYEEFSHTFRHLVAKSGLRNHGFVEETVDTESMARSFSMRVEPHGGQDAEPFYVTCKLAFKWSPLLSARSYTTEDDALREFVGDYDHDSLAPWVRVDVELAATLQYGKPMKMPSAAAWTKWANEVHVRMERLNRLLPEETVRETEDGNLEVLAFKDTPSVELTVDPSGRLDVTALRLSGWEGITLPRQWSDSTRSDADPDDALEEMFGRVRNALQAWMEALDHFKLAA